MLAQVSSSSIPPVLGWYIISVILLVGIVALQILNTISNLQARKSQRRDIAVLPETVTKEQCHTMHVDFDRRLAKVETETEDLRRCRAADAQAIREIIQSAVAPINQRLMAVSDALRTMEGTVTADRETTRVRLSTIETDIKTLLSR